METLTENLTGTAITQCNMAFLVETVSTLIATITLISIVTIIALMMPA